MEETNKLEFDRLSQEIEKHRIIEKRLFKRYNKVCSEINSKQEEISELIQSLQKICPHTETEYKYKNEEGTYLDRARYYTFTICKHCGKTVHTKETLGGYG
jgi:preprotein translocase subunit SecA